MNAYLSEKLFFLWFSSRSPCFTHIKHLNVHTYLTYIPVKPVSPLPIALDKVEHGSQWRVWWKTEWNKCSMSLQTDKSIFLPRDWQSAFNSKWWHFHTQVFPLLDGSCSYHHALIFHHPNYASGVHSPKERAPHPFPLVKYCKSVQT